MRWWTKENRVGRVRLIPGRQLADVTAVSTDPNVAPITVPGYISEITAAACVPLNGQQDCFTADELWQVAETADPAALGRRRVGRRRGRRPRRIRGSGWRA